MTEVEPTPGIDASDAFLRALIVVAIFAIVGPPVGGLIAWLGMGATSLQSPVPFVLGSYGEGLLLAAGTGLYVGASWWLFGKTSFIAPIVGAILANLLFHASTMTAVPDPGTVSRLAYVFLPGSIVAALTCWLIAKRLFPR